MSDENFKIVEQRLRNAFGVRAALPPHQGPPSPVRGERVDITEYYYNHNAIDPIQPVIGFEVPQGHLFFLDNITIAGNIFQSPSWWDWPFVHLRLYVDNVFSNEFTTGSNGIIRPQLALGADSPLNEVSPLLYVSNDISDPCMSVLANNLDAGDDSLIRIRSGHSPAFGLLHEAHGPKRTYRSRQRIEVRYDVLGPNDPATAHTASGAALYTQWLQVIQQHGCGNVTGVPAGPDNNAATDDAGLYAVGAFTPLVLAATLTLTDQDRATAVAAIPALAAWVGGESIGVDVGANAAIYLTNKFILFLNQASSQAEVNLVTWQVGASANNNAWFQLRLDQVRYREIPSLSLYWVEFEFTNNNVNVPYSSSIRGWPVSNQNFRYFKVRASAIAAGISPTLRVTEASVGYGLYHRIAARMSGWLWRPEFDVISSGGGRVA